MVTSFDRYDSRMLPEKDTHRVNSEVPLLRKVAPWIVTVCFSIGAAAALALIVYVFASDQTALKTLLIPHVRAIVGIPLAAFSAFFIVFVFEATSGRIEFEIGPIRFRGASGPAVLWVFAFMGHSGGYRDALEVRICEVASA